MAKIVILIILLVVFIYIIYSVYGYTTYKYGGRLIGGLEKLLKYTTPYEPLLEKGSITSLKEPMQTNETSEVVLGGKPVQIGYVYPRNLTKTRKWYDCQTWGMLEKSPKLLNEYHIDKYNFIENMCIDWDPVLKYLKKYLLGTREYAGLINITNNNKAWVSYIRASPFDKGDKPDNNRLAYVPGWLLAQISRKPAMFMFHTHPPSSVCWAPSAADYLSGFRVLKHGYYAAQLVISDAGVTMWGLKQEVLIDIWSAADPFCVYARRLYDLFTSIQSLRQWCRPPTTGEFKDMLNKHGIFIHFSINGRYTHNAAIMDIFHDKTDMVLFNYVTNILTHGESH